MSFTPLKITFQLDGTGVYYDPHEPLMLDSILAAACSHHHVHGEPPARDEEPFDVPLPLSRWQHSGTWGYRASALFPEGDTLETLRFWRKRLRQNRIELTDGSPNLTNGIYRDWNMPLPLLLCRSMVAHAVGERREVRRELRRNIRWLGKKRAHGHGRVVDIEVENCEHDYSIERDGVMTRWMPQEGGTRLVRPRPPYWNICGRVACNEIGERR
jgi:hypothetical protein